MHVDTSPSAWPAHRPWRRLYARHNYTHVQEENKMTIILLLMDR